MNRQFITPVLGIGFLIWLFATLAFRFAGQFFFITESAVLFTTLYILIIPILALLSIITFKQFKLEGLENIAGGVLLVLPGMLLDTFVIQFFGDIFPNMPDTRAAAFGSWLMWAYSTVLVTSILIAFRSKKVKTID